MGTVSGYVYDACPKCGFMKDVRARTCFECRDTSASTRAQMARRLAAWMAGGFWTKVDKAAGPDACWPWTGAKQHKDPRYPTRGGYGWFLVNGKQRYVHRHVLEITLGRPLAPGEIAMHSCDNPPCCNPRHLHPGTHADNMADMVAKGRDRYSRSRSAA